MVHLSIYGCLSNGGFPAVSFLVGFVGAFVLVFACLFWCFVFVVLSFFFWFGFFGGILVVLVFCLFRFFGLFCLLVLLLVFQSSVTKLGTFFSFRTVFLPMLVNCKDFKQLQ